MDNSRPTLLFTYFISFYPREYAKRNEKVIEDDSEFTDSLARLLVASLRCKLSGRNVLLRMNRAIICCKRI